MTDLQGKPVSYKLENITIAGKAWGSPNGKPVLAIHGWLDNCASFDFIAPHLGDDIYLLAIDTAGHGETSHREPGGNYHLWNDVRDIVELVDHLGWEKFALLGHSRGAVISILTAGAFPERITHLSLIDCLIPFVKPPQEAPEQLALSVTAALKQRGKHPTRYPSFDDAITTRMQGNYPLSREAAETLAARGVKEMDDGKVYWAYDPRLKLPSALYFSVEHIEAFLKNVTAPIQLLLAKEGLITHHPEFFKFLERVKFIEPVWFEGGHHLHMEEEASNIAGLLREFCN